jgi:hypothetical protein
MGYEISCMLHYTVCWQSKVTNYYASHYEIFSSPLTSSQHYWDSNPSVAPYKTKKLCFAGYLASLACPAMRLPMSQLKWPHCAGPSCLIEFWAVIFGPSYIALFYPCGKVNELILKVKSWAWWSHPYKHMIPPSEPRGMRRSCSVSKLVTCPWHVPGTYSKQSLSFHLMLWENQKLHNNLSKRYMTQVSNLRYIPFWKLNFGFVGSQIIQHVQTLF